MLPPEDVPRKVGSLPPYAPFSISSIAHFNRSILVGCNLGILKFDDGRLSGLYQQDASDPPIDGPWSDSAHESVWFQAESTLNLIRLDKEGWHILSMPSKRAGSFTRGDLLHGYRGVGDASEFWIVGGGSVWRRGEREDQWIEEAEVPAESRLETVAALEGQLIYIVRDVPSESGSSGKRRRESSRLLLKVNDGWKDLAPGQMIPPVTRAVSGKATAYLLAEDGSIRELGLSGAKLIPGPGPAETISISPGGQLWGAFRSSGICSLENGKWEHKFDLPPVQESQFRVKSISVETTSDGSVMAAIVTRSADKQYEAWEWAAHKYRRLWPLNQQ